MQYRTLGLFLVLLTFASLTAATNHTEPTDIEATFTPDTVGPGDPFNITLEATRDGERVAATVNASFYANDVRVDHDTIDIDGFHTDTGDFPTEDDEIFETGDWRLVAVTDGPNGTTVSDEDTFEVVDDTGKLAAEIVAIEAPSNVKYGSLFDVNVTITNTGTEPYDGYIFFGDADGLYGNSRDISDLLDSALEPNQTATVTLPAGVPERDGEPEPGESEKLAVELGLHDSVDHLDRELYTVYVEGTGDDTGLSITDVSGVDEQVAAGQTIELTVAIENSGSTAVNATIGAEHVAEPYDAQYAAKATKQSRDVSLDAGHVRKQSFRFELDDAPAVHTFTFELRSGETFHGSETVKVSAGEPNQRRPDDIKVAVRPTTVSPGDRFDLIVRPSANGEPVNGVEGTTEVYVNGELVNTETGELEPELGEDFPGPDDLEGFAYGEWRIVVRAGNVSGEATFEVVRGDGSAEGRKITLRPGWNMIATDKPVPLKEITEDCRVDTYQGAKIWTFSGDWTHPDVLQPTRSYYLHASRRCVATVAGTASATGQDTQPASIKLEEGWNMVSLPGGMQASLDDIAGDCSINEYQGSPVWSYDTRAGWQQYDRSRALRSTEGYFVNVDGACALQLQQTTTPPTPGEPEDDDDEVPLAGEWKYGQAPTCKFRGEGSGYRCSSDLEFDEEGGYWCECVNLTWVRYH